VPLLITWFLTYEFSIDLAGQKVNQELTAINKNLTTHVDDWVDTNQRMLLQNASLQKIRSMRADEQNPILKTITDQYDWAYLAFTIDPEGDNIGRSDGKAPKFYGDRIYFRQALGGQKFGKQVLIGKTSGKPAMVLSTAINDETGRLRGVIALAMTLTDLSTEIANANIGKTGFTFLLDKTGEVIAHPNEEITRSRVDMSNHPAFQAQKKGQSLIIYNDDDGKKIIAVSQQTKDGWVMITQQNYTEAYAKIESEIIRAIILLVVTAVIVCILALVTSRRLTGPILQLTEVADQYSQGNLNLQIAALERKDEIGQLAQSIERLGTSIRIAIERLKKRTA
jgi:methyl-accepting chemotaxis protein